MLRSLRQLGSHWGALSEARLVANGAQAVEGCSTLQRWLRPGVAWQQSAGYSTEEFRKLVQNSSPCSLQFQRQPAEEVAQEAQRGFAIKALLTLGGYYSKESRHMRAAQRLYTAVTEQAVGPAFLQAMGIPGEFQQQHSSLCLHIWLLLVRLRSEGKDGKHLAQLLYDDFQTDVEDRARKAGVRVRLQKMLTELEKQFYGSSMAYDKAMAGGEPLEKALLRNVYLLDQSKSSDAKLLARYVRRELACLSLTPSDAVMAGNLKFTSEGLEGMEDSGAGAALQADATAAGSAAAEPGGKQAAPAAGSAA